MTSPSFSISTLKKNKKITPSATGISSLADCGYLTRMSIHGPGTSFPTFAAFASELSSRGPSFLEAMASELKGSGQFVARTLGELNFSVCFFRDLRAFLFERDSSCTFFVAAEEEEEDDKEEKKRKTQLFFFVVVVDGKKNTFSPKKISPFFSPSLTNHQKQKQQRSTAARSPASSARSTRTTSRSTTRRRRCGRGSPPSSRKRWRTSASTAGTRR